MTLRGWDLPVLDGSSVTVNERPVVMVTSGGDEIVSDHARRIDLVVCLADGSRLLADVSEIRIEPASETAGHPTREMVQ